MKTYQMSDTFKAATSPSAIYSPYFIFRDKKVPKSQELSKLFKSSYKIFRVRVRDLGNLEMKTNNRDADAMRIMLEALITAKKKLT